MDAKQLMLPTAKRLLHRKSSQSRQLLNFADKEKEAEFNDCAGDRANSGQPASIS
jgi:hypothetical protein